MEPAEHGVLLSWTRPAGVDRVRVLRSLPDQPLPSRPDPSLLLRFTGDTFRDSDVEPGAAYSYRVYTEAQTLGSQDGSFESSAGLVRTVTVPGRPDAVTDLRAAIELRDGRPGVTVGWTRPGRGTAVIYLSVRRTERRHRARRGPGAGPVGAAGAAARPAGPGARDPGRRPGVDRVDAAGHPRGRWASLPVDHHRGHRVLRVLAHRGASAGALRRRHRRAADRGTGRLAAGPVQLAHRGQLPRGVDCRPGRAIPRRAAADPSTATSSTSTAGWSWRCHRNPWMCWSRATPGMPTPASRAASSGSSYPGRWVVRYDLAVGRPVLLVAPAAAVGGSARAGPTCRSC